MLSVLQMLISYSEALPESLGLEPAEGSTKLTQRLFGKPGVPHSLSLTQTLSKPADATTLRTVLNAGSDTQRTIVSDQMLRIVDE